MRNMRERLTTTKSSDIQIMIEYDGDMRNRRFSKVLDKCPLARPGPFPYVWLAVRIFVSKQRVTTYYTLRFQDYSTTF